MLRSGLYDGIVCDHAVVVWMNAALLLIDSPLASASCLNTELTLYYFASGLTLLPDTPSSGLQVFILINSYNV